MQGGGRVCVYELTKQKINSQPASRKKALLPNLSTKAIDMSAATTRAALVITDEYRAALDPNPKL